MDALLERSLRQTAEPGHEYRHWLAHRGASSTVEVWSGQGHWLDQVDPERFALTVKRYFRQARAQNP